MSPGLAALSPVHALPTAAQMASTTSAAKAPERPPPVARGKASPKPTKYTGVAVRVARNAAVASLLSALSAGGGRPVIAAALGVGRMAGPARMGTDDRAALRPHIATLIALASGSGGRAGAGEPEPGLEPSEFAALLALLANLSLDLEAKVPLMAAVPLVVRALSKDTHGTLQGVVVVVGGGGSGVGAPTGPLRWCAAALRSFRSRR